MGSTTVLQPRRAFVGSSIRLYRDLGFIGLSPGLGFIRLDQGLEFIGFSSCTSVPKSTFPYLCFVFAILVLRLSGSTGHLGI